MQPIPFEALHPQEALIMQSVFQSGLVIRDAGPYGLFIATPRKHPHRRMKPHIKRAIERIRPMTATTALPIPLCYRRPNPKASCWWKNKD